MRLITPILAIASSLLATSLLVTSMPVANADTARVTAPHAAKPINIIYQSAQSSLSDVKAAVEALTNGTVTAVRHMSGGAHVISLDSTLTEFETRKLLAELQTSGVIDFGQIDAAVRISTTPNDELFSGQWYLEPSSNIVASMNLEQAWEITTGSPDIVIAVIDTGIRFEHTDLTNRLLAGYDFVSGINEAAETFIPVSPENNFLKSNDGDGRDVDPTDPGDGVDTEFQNQMSALGIDCPLTDSTWHGTAMASLLAANGNDGAGMTGIDWQAKILPIRAIGRCGGNRSDLLDAIRWAAGVEDKYLPINPNPARIINLSLGIDDLCGPADQKAIDDAINAGAIIIAAVGNNARDLNSQPAAPSDCDNVIGVSAVNASGQLANYSNYGYDADIAAPGGEERNGDGNTIMVAANSGAIDPLPGSSYRYTSGTSVASPLVAGVISLMLSINPDLTNGQIETVLYGSARSFMSAASISNCQLSTCGAGIVDAHAAVKTAQRSLIEPPAEYVEPEIVTPTFAAASSFEPTILTGGGAGCTINLNGAPDDPTWLLSLALLILYRKRRNRRQAVRISSRSNDVA